MNYNVTLCHLCGQALTFKQLRKAVYWLPDMDNTELSWVVYGGEAFVHNFAHRACWQQLREKRRELIRICSFKDQGPRSMGAEM